VNFCRRVLEVGASDTLVRYSALASTGALRQILDAIQWRPRELNGQYIVLWML
jgi:hypothetical protein